jgi:pyruvate/2-oxoglutarate dehydrogenase complex dihydrolipoamide dehydrogenase (E3) component
MSPVRSTLKVDICVIGGGSGGLSVAAGAARMGARVALIEKGRMGGDCLNTGCVPSKALIACAAAAHAVGRAAAFGVKAGDPEIDGAAVHAHIRRTIKAIEPNDSIERFQSMGVHVIKAAACFTGPGEVQAGDETIRARRFVIATGSGPFVPPVPGLDGVPYLTNETVFDLGRIPGHLIVIGGGPVGVEIAQAYRRLGARVTVLEMFSILPNDDPELADVVRRRLTFEGVDLREGVKVVGVSGSAGDLRVSFAAGDNRGMVGGTHILLATGRRPNLDGLGLEAAGVDAAPHGITVDARLRTTNKKIFAIGDVTGGLRFTHVASYHAAVVIKNALFRLPARAVTAAAPWVTYTDPELAQVGLSETAALEKGFKINVLRWPFADNDRARAELETDGMVKVVTGKRGRILGCGIAGAHAGELIQTWIPAVAGKRKIGVIANMIAPYPTLGEASKRAAGSFFAPMLFSARSRRLVRFLSFFG